MTRRVRRREALGLVACASTLTLLAVVRPGDQGDSITDVRADGPAAVSRPGPVSVPAERLPVRVTAAAIGLDEPVRALGLSEAGDISPPVGVVQWYTGSVAPGERGVAVLAGHVSAPRPDVFRRLDELTVGARVRVDVGGGSLRTFVVERTARVDKQDLTRDRSVWGSSERRMLVLITCDDTSSVDRGSYRGNVVVWAVAV